MSKGKAAIETLVISILIPVLIWTAMIYSLRMIFPFPTVVIVAILVSIFAYSYIVYSRHKELGKFFVALTAVFSTAVQFVVVMVVLAGLGDGFSSGQGHPNGTAVLMLVILFLEPLWINLASFFIWLFKKIIWVFKEDE